MIISAKTLGFTVPFWYVNKSNFVFLIYVPLVNDIIASNVCVCIQCGFINS